MLRSIQDLFIQLKLVYEKKTHLIITPPNKTF